MTRARRHLSFANVVASIALFVALGGAGYAAIALPKNSVGTKQLKKNAVTAKKIRASAVSSRKVANASLLAEDFAAGQLPAGPEGPRGPQGERGEDGEDGAKGDTGTFGAVTVQFETAAADLADGAEASYDVHCPAGQTAIGGGFRGDFSNSEETNVGSSRPIISTTNSTAPVDGGTFTGWRISVQNVAGGVTDGIRPEVWVICAQPTTPAR